MARFTAVLDTCVLYSTLNRSLLLHLAEVDMYRPLWSGSILEELGRNLQAKAGLKLEQTQYLIQEMGNAFPEALVSDNSTLIEKIHPLLTDPGDAHVIAAAVVGKADAIVTFNLKHFRPEILEQFQLEAIGPDEFLVNQWDLDEIATLQAAKDCHGSLKKNPPTWEEWLQRLEKVNLTQFAAKLRQGPFRNRSQRG